MQIKKQLEINYLYKYKIKFQKLFEPNKYFQLTEIIFPLIMTSQLR